MKILPKLPENLFTEDNYFWDESFSDYDVMDLVDKWGNWILSPFRFEHIQDPV